MAWPTASRQRNAAPLRTLALEEACPVSLPHVSKSRWEVGGKGGAHLARPWQRRTGASTCRTGREGRWSGRRSTARRLSGIGGSSQSIPPGFDALNRVCITIDQMYTPMFSTTTMYRPYCARRRWLTPFMSRMKPRPKHPTLLRFSRSSAHVGLGMKMIVGLTCRRRGRRATRARGRVRRSTCRGRWTRSRCSRQ